MYSTVLVIVQFIAVVVIVTFGTVPGSIIGIVVLSAGGLLGAVSILTMRWDNLRIFPEPKKGIRLITAGPYRFIRHPMYTSLLMSTGPFIGGEHAATVLAVWCILLSVLVGKMRIEERMLGEMLPDYRGYMKRTKKLIPFFF